MEDRAYRNSLVNVALNVQRNSPPFTDWDAALDLATAYIDIAIERGRDEDTRARAALAACQLIGDYQLRLSVTPELTASQRSAS